MQKKTFITLGTITTVLSPIAFTISCGADDNRGRINGLLKITQGVIDDLVQKLEESLPVTKPDADKPEEGQVLYSILTSDKGDSKLSETIGAKKAGEAIAPFELGINLEAFNMLPGMGVAFTAKSEYAIPEHEAVGQILVRTRFYSLANNNIYREMDILIKSQLEVNLSTIVKSYVDMLTLDPVTKAPIKPMSTKTKAELKESLGHKKSVTADELGINEPNYLSFVPLLKTLNMDVRDKLSTETNVEYLDYLKDYIRVSYVIGPYRETDTIRVQVRFEINGAAVIANVGTFTLNAKDATV